VHPSHFTKLILSITTLPVLRLVHLFRQQLCQWGVFGHMLIYEIWCGNLVVLILEVLDVILILEKLELPRLHILFLLIISLF
jgi:hypothetical protein